MKDLVIEATAENLDSLLAFITDELEQHGCPLKLVTQINIAVEEIFVNIAYYAYNPEVGNAIIRVSVDDEVTIVMEDYGRPYNPLIRDDPNIQASAEEREIGGLGIFMVKKIMDAVEYHYENGKNILVIKKSLMQV